MEILKTLIYALLFSTLFYKQNIGLNLLLFSVLVIIILIINNVKIIKNRNIYFKLITYILTGITVFLYNSNLSITANIIAFFTVIGSVSEHKSSIYIKWMNGIYTSIAAVFTLYYDSLNTEVENVKRVKINYLYWLKIIGIPIAFIIIFINLYRNGNPMFDELILIIDFSFINLHWLLFVVLGYFLFYNISNPIQIEPLTSLDIGTDNYLNKNTLKNISQKKLKSEKQLGIVLMSSLNILIIFFIITDIFHLSEIHKMIASELSKQVHNGVNALIFSNI